MKKIIKIYLLCTLAIFLFSYGPLNSMAQEDLDVEPTIEDELGKDILGAKKTDEKNTEESLPPKQVLNEEPITFSARNIPAKDAFATLAKISGRSITVGSDIRDDELISVIEIQNQNFEEAFFSLVDAAMVNYTTTGNSYTIIKSGSANPIMIFGLGASSIDKSLPLLERKADISYDNQDLGTLLKDLANKYGIDLVLTSTPTERVSCRVRSVNIEEALDLVLSGTSFDYTIVGENKATYVIYNRLNKNFTVGQESRMFPLMNLEAMDVQQLLPVEVRTNVRISNDQNSIIADGSQNDLKRIEEFLARIDKPLPQVELELKLIEVQKSAAQDLQLFLSGGSSIGNFSKFPLKDIRKTGATDDAGNPIAGDHIRTGSVTVFDFSLDTWKLFNNKLTYLETAGLAEIRAYPKLVSLSGRTAMINIDQDTNLVLGTASGGQGGQPIGVVQTQQLQRITAGTALSITPIVGAGGLITAKIQIEVSDNSGISESQNGVKVPKTTTRRRINADVQVRNGETVAIGGLIIDNSATDRKGLPFITRIPILNNFGSNRNHSKTQSELIVLITPRIRNIPEENITAQKEKPTANIITGN